MLLTSRVSPPLFILSTSLNPPLQTVPHCSQQKISDYWLSNKHFYDLAIHFQLLTHLVGTVPTRGKGVLSDGLELHFCE